MRSGGFPCRQHGCQAQFAVAVSSSMASLLDASAARTAHELLAHDYRHPPPLEDSRRTPYVAKAKAKTT
jgi:hypothetical protein